MSYSDLSHLLDDVIAFVTEYSTREKSYLAQIDQLTKDNAMLEAEVGTDASEIKALSAKIAQLSALITKPPALLSAPTLQ